MYPENFRALLQTAVHGYEQQRGRKPSLLQISKHDFDALCRNSVEKTRLGLTIEGVPIIGLSDIDDKVYYLLP